MRTGRHVSNRLWHFASVSRFEGPWVEGLYLRLVSLLPGQESFRQCNIGMYISSVKLRAFAGHIGSMRSNAGGQEVAYQKGVNHWYGEDGNDSRLGALNLSWREGAPSSGNESQ
jgi:hypothetical protein